MPSPTMKTVTYHVTKPDGVAWRRPRITFELTPGSYEDAGIFPSSIVKGDVDASGNGSISLWANEGGEETSRYKVTLPSGESFWMTVPVAGGPFTLSELRADA